MCSKDLVAQARFVPATSVIGFTSFVTTAPAATTAPGHDGFACGEALKAFFEFHLFSKVTSKSIKRFYD